MDKRSRDARIHRIRATIQALPEHMPQMGAFMLDGEPYDVTGIAGLLAEELDAIDAVRQATAVRTEAIARERRVKRRNSRLLVALESLLRGYYGDNVVVLRAFELAPRRKGHKSAEVKRAAAEKGKATRASNRTARDAARRARPAPKKRRRKR